MLAEGFCAPPEYLSRLEFVILGMTPPALSLAEKYTYADYTTWPDEERWELIEGIAYNMTPAPTRKHQQILIKLGAEIQFFLKGKSCEVNVAPFDIRLPKADQSADESDTVVQPDISVYCDKSMLDKKGAIGPPDWVVEILSPNTSHKDMTVKSYLYQAHGVKEYWIIDPEVNRVQVFLLDPELKRFGIPQQYSEDATLPPSLFPELKIDLKEIFQE